MVVFNMESKNGKLLSIGLTNADLSVLLEGKPLPFMHDGMEVVVFYDKTHADIVAQLKRLGIVDQQTKIETREETKL